MQPKESELRRYALRTSALVLLLGNEKEIYKTAKMLYHKYGIPSYTVLPSKPRFETYLYRFLRPYLSVIKGEAQAPFFLAARALSFFRNCDERLIPIVIDCTDGALLLNNSTIKAQLTESCFLADSASFEQTPPFSFPAEKGEAP